MLIPPAYHSNMWYFIHFAFLWGFIHKIMLPDESEDLAYFLFVSLFIYLFFKFLKMFYFIFERESTRSQAGQRGKREKGRHRIRSKLQALSCQHRAQCRAWTHELQDHDLSQSRSLDQLSHPGTLSMWFLISRSWVQALHCVWSLLKIKKQTNKQNPHLYALSPW